MNFRPWRYALLAALFVLVSCQSKTESENAGNEEEKTMAETHEQEPDVVTVQHILIGFQGSIPGKNITRTKEEAKTLAEEILAEAKSDPESFPDLVRDNTDDSFPGVYTMTNFGVTTAPEGRQAYQRERMVAAFGDVGFPLEVGEIGLAEYDPQKSPYGYHIIKRIE